MKRILVVTDGSEGAGRAVDYAAGLASVPGAHLLILNVFGMRDLPEAVLSQFTRTQIQWLHDILAEQSAKILTTARERAQAAGAEAVQLESRDGDVAEMTLQVAAETAADAIVVGKRGTGRVSGLLLGSVSQKLVSIAPIPLIVIP